MALRTITVYFCSTSVGEEGSPLKEQLQAAVSTHGEHLPVAEVEGERFQIRSLQLVGDVWKGSFVKLRDDPPNYLHENEEKEFELAEGAHVIEKCFFLYRRQNNVLVWQVQRSAGGISKAANYLSIVLGSAVMLPQLMNNAELEDMLTQNLYEIDFAYARPAERPDKVGMWTARAFDIMGDVHASVAKFTLRAGHGHMLAESAKNVVKEMIGQPGFKKVKVRLTSDSDPVKLFLAPLKEQFTIEYLGRYAPPKQVFEGLEDAYTRQEEHIPGAARH